MSRDTDTHSRIVFWLKILLPLAALAVLSTLFLYSRNIGGDGLLPFSDVDVEELARDQRLTSPQFEGITSDGGALAVQAEVARPDPNGGGGTANGIAATYTLGTDTASVSAEKGHLNTAAFEMRLEGGVRIETSSGYRISAEILTGRLDRTEVISPGPVTVEAPFGQITAGSMTLIGEAGTHAGHVLVFKNGVRLVYDPRT
jgi:lipopolysaccharide export system protein LptC